MPAFRKLLERLVADYGDDIVRRARDIVGIDAEPAQIESAVRRLAPKPARKALPAPPKALALPAPKGRKNAAREGYSVVDLGDHAVDPVRRFRVMRPGGVEDSPWEMSEGDAWAFADMAANPRSKFKPKGGQWLPDTPSLRRAGHIAPERAAAEAWGDAIEVGAAPPDAQSLQDWWHRAVPRYLKTDFGTEQDPLLDLAERNLLHIPDTNAERWAEVSRTNILPETVEYFTVPPHANNPYAVSAGPRKQAEVLQAAPWLAKQPATDMVYSLFTAKGLGLPHLRDEILNAMRPDSGLPADLAVRPESLQRMGFPQAVERVGRINQWRAAHKAEADLARANNAAVHTYREYPDNNPMGLRWAGIKAPPGTRRVPPAHGLSDEGLASELSHEDAGLRALSDALAYEGDAMGHCVGGYCDKVAGGATRIFSLRDAKGEPHVTVETRRGTPAHNPRGVESALFDMGRGVLRSVTEHPEYEALGAAATTERHFPDLWERLNNAPDDIIQIKGKSNRAPVDAYLPFVQDFVKNGTWGHIRDFENTGLVKLPDGRYITGAQLEEVATSPASLSIFDTPELARQNLAAWNLNSLSDQDWEDTKHLFDGFAIGGRVDARRCFARNPMAVR